MADVNAVFGTLLALGIVYPGMLIAWSLIFPSFVGKASARIESTPWLSAWHLRFRSESPRSSCSRSHWVLPIFWEGP